MELRDTRIDFAELRAAVPVRAVASPRRRRASVAQEAAAEVSPAVARFLGAVDGARRSRDGWMALCPAHDDHNPSLSIAEGDDGCCLIKCFSGCSTAAVVTALGFEMADLFDAAPVSSGAESEATKLIRMAQEHGAELVHDERQVPYVCLRRDGHMSKRSRCEDRSS